MTQPGTAPAVGPPQRPFAPHGGMTTLGVVTVISGSLLLIAGLSAANGSALIGAVLMIMGMMFCLLDVLRHIYQFGLPRN